MRMSPFGRRTAPWPARAPKTAPARPVSFSHVAPASADLGPRAGELDPEAFDGAANECYDGHNIA